MRTFDKIFNKVVTIFWYILSLMGFALIAFVIMMLLQGCTPINKVFYWFEHSDNMVMTEEVCDTSPIGTFGCSAYEDKQQ